jgi:hypothetical protein
MVAFWKRARRRALMSEPTDKQLKWYLECFTAGYQRGVADVRSFTPREEWVEQTAVISRRLATDRSVIEAGCWLTGQRLGRDDAVAGEDDIPDRIKWQFCRGWESEYIGECALECDPTAVKLTKALTGACRRGPASLSVRLSRRA